MLCQSPREAAARAKQYTAWAGGGGRPAQQKHTEEEQEQRLCWRASFHFEDLTLWQDLLYTFRSRGRYTKNTLQWSIGQLMSQACHRTSSTFNGLRNKLLSSHLYRQPGCGSMQINMAAPASADCPGLRCPELDHSYRFPLSRWDFLGFRLKTWQTLVASSFQDYLIKIQKESWQTQLTNT